MSNNRNRLVSLKLLKRYFDAARKIDENKTIKEWAEGRDFAEVTVHKFFNGEVNSEPLAEQVIRYIKAQGLEKNLTQAGYDLESKPYKMARRI